MRIYGIFHRGEAQADYPTFKCYVGKEGLKLDVRGHSVRFTGFKIGFFVRCVECGFWQLNFSQKLRKKWVKQLGPKP